MFTCITKATAWVKQAVKALYIIVCDFFSAEDPVDRVYVVPAMAGWYFKAEAAEQAESETVFGRSLTGLELKYLACYRALGIDPVTVKESGAELNCYHSDLFMMLRKGIVVNPQQNYWRINHDYGYVANLWHLGGPLPAILEMFSISDWNEIAKLAIHKNLIDTVDTEVNNIYAEFQLGKLTSGNFHGCSFSVARVGRSKNIRKHAGTVVSYIPQCIDAFSVFCDGLEKSGLITISQLEEIKSCMI